MDNQVDLIQWLLANIPGGSISVLLLVLYLRMEKRYFDLDRVHRRTLRHFANVPDDVEPDNGDLG